MVNNPTFFQITIFMNENSACLLPFNDVGDDMAICLMFSKYTGQRLDEAQQLDNKTVQDSSSKSVALSQI